MSPNQAICSDKSIRFSPLAAARPLTIRSWPEVSEIRGNPVSVHHSGPKRRTDTGFPALTPDFPHGKGPIL